MSRELRILLVAAGIAIVLGVIFYAIGLGSVGPSTAPISEASVPFTLVKEGVQTSVTERTNYLITSTKQMQDLWKTIGATGTLPTINFSKQAVIAVFAGAPHVGIAVAHVTDAAKRTVTIALTKPNPACPPSTQPGGSDYAIVAMSATTLSFTHTDTATTATCGAK